VLFLIGEKIDDEYSPLPRFVFVVLAVKKVKETTKPHLVSFFLVSATEKKTYAR